MNTIELRKRIIADAILTTFAEGKINTQSDVDVIMIKVQNNLNMTADQAAEFFKNAIGTNN